MGGSIHTGYVCICQYILLVRCSRDLYNLAQLVGGLSAVGMSIFCNTLHVVWLCTLGLDQWGEGASAPLGMSVFLNMFYWLGVVGLCILGLD